MMHIQVKHSNSSQPVDNNLIAEKTCTSGSMTFSPDKRILACDDWNDNINLMDVQTNTRLHTLSGHTEEISQIITLVGAL